jgi:hypothetical protein
MATPFTLTSDSVAQPGIRRARPDSSSVARSTVIVTSPFHGYAVRTVTAKSSVAIRASAYWQRKSVPLR